MKKSKTMSNKSVLLEQVLNLLDDSQEITLIGRTGEKKTGIDTVKFIRKTERLLLTQPVEGISLKEGDTYLIIRLAKV